MEMFVNCNTSSLAPYAPPLDKIRVQHLYRRLGFSASNAEVDAAVGQTANALVDNLVDAALASAPIPAPEWATWTNADYPADDDLARQLRNAQREEFAIAYGNAMLTNNLLDRLSFFWSNHVVTELRIYNCNAYLYEYINCLQRNSLGNFRTLISEIGLTNAMLYYLDGAYNNGNNPNENYSRELYELFTLGEGNEYTEEDIIETSRALSGYTNRGEVGCSPVTYNPERHDAGTKTILGQTGNWGYDDVMNILFQTRAGSIARFICTKLYEFFVHPDSKSDEYDPGGTYPVGHPQGIINELAETFVSSNFELAPVLRQMFKSEHFFDETTIGVIIKSPFDLYFHLIKELGFAYDDGFVQNLIDASALIGQELFNPVDVAGWQRDRQWINTNFIIGRWLTSELFVDQLFQQDQERFRSLAIDLVGPANSNTSNPEIVVRAIVDKFTPKGLLTDQDFENAMDAFKIDDVPENYYSPDYIDGGLSLWILAVSMEAPIQVYTLLRYLTRQPEFQLK